MIIERLRPTQFDEIIFLVIMLLFLLLACYLIVTSFRIFKYKGESSGEVANITISTIVDENGIPKDIRNYWISYKVWKNKVLVEIPIDYGNYENLYIGQKVIVRYDKDNPEKLILGNVEYNKHQILRLQGFGGVVLMCFLVNYLFINEIYYFISIPLIILLLIIYLIYAFITLYIFDRK